MIKQILFLASLFVAGFILWRRILRIASSIALGKPIVPDGSVAQRWKNVILVAFGQRKMFKRFFPAFLHLWVYVGFLVINVEVLEFIVDGLLGTHRAFAPCLGVLYPIGITAFEALALAVLVACKIFWWRRNLFKIRRFWSTEMTRKPRRDANNILVAEILLMLAILTMNAADLNLQYRGEYPAVGPFMISAWIAPLFQSLSTPALIALERATWWFHILGIMGFAIYVTYSKHLHIFMAFPATYYARLEPKGHMQTMPVVTREVRSMLGFDSTPSSSGEVARLGAKDVNDLSRTALLGAYACTECGRCTSECPANIVGRKLSPRKIMMDTRRRLTEVADSAAAGGKSLNDGKALLGDYVSKEEINACTSCNACVEACPVLLNPLEIILELRRYVAMEESGAPAQWNALFQNIETNFAPWKFPASERFDWAADKPPVA